MSVPPGYVIKGVKIMREATVASVIKDIDTYRTMSVWVSIVICRTESRHFCDQNVTDFQRSY